MQELRDKAGLKSWISRSTLGQNLEKHQETSVQKQNRKSCSVTMRHHFSSAVLRTDKPLMSWQKICSVTGEDSVTKCQTMVQLCRTKRSTEEDFWKITSCWPLKCRQSVEEWASCLAFARQIVLRHNLSQTEQLPASNVWLDMVARYSTIKIDVAWTDKW